MWVLLAYRRSARLDGHSVQSLEISCELMPAVSLDRVAVMRQCSEPSQVGQRDPDGQFEGQTRSHAHVNQSEARQVTAS